MSWCLVGSEMCIRDRRWMNYQVQGLQIMLGANYKFDF
jgi:hypothetical protein